MSRLSVPRLAKLDSVMIDQPEIFVSPDSKYKGLKPDDAKALADAIQERRLE
jgi:hypothetical protein